jgi:hypothetical protein
MLLTAWRRAEEPEREKISSPFQILRRLSYPSSSPRIHGWPEEEEEAQ